MEQVSPGYRRVGELGEALVDPQMCPGGHPFAFGQRSWEPCPEHRGHPSWVCACGREQFLRRSDGAIVEQLDCVSGR